MSKRFGLTIAEKWLFKRNELDQSLYYEPSRQNWLAYDVWFAVAWMNKEDRSHGHSDIDSNNHRDYVENKCVVVSVGLDSHISCILFCIWKLDVYNHPQTSASRWKGHVFWYTSYSNQSRTPGGSNSSGLKLKFAMLYPVTGNMRSHGPPPFIHSWAQSPVLLTLPVAVSTTSHDTTHRCWPIKRELAYNA